MGFTITVNSNMQQHSVQQSHMCCVTQQADISASRCILHLLTPA